MEIKERPIIFSSEMVSAILEGRKTQTRRVIKPQPASQIFLKYGCWASAWVEGEYICPYGTIGERLWVRETWAQIYKHPDCVGDEPCDFKKCRGCYIEYKADTNNPCPGEWDIDAAREDEDVPRWQPSIHMPRWASRITLEIVNLRVERLQEITEKDAIEEGIRLFNLGDFNGYASNPQNKSFYGYAKEAFKNLWNSIYVKRGFGWDTNPWVWVIEFKQLSTIKIEEEI